VSEEARGLSLEFKAIHAALVARKIEVLYVYTPGAMRECMCFEKLFCPENLAGVWPFPRRTLFIFAKSIHATFYLMRSKTCDDTTLGFGG
jgi:hypothetical protein